MSHPGRAESAREPFVGRRREIAELEAGLRAAIAGRGRSFLVLGEAGIGKTRLADEMGSRALAGGATVVWGRCWEAGGAPAYWPWTQLLRALVGVLGPGVLAEKLGDEARRLAEVLSERSARVPALDERAPSAFDSADARFYFFDAVTTFLGKIAADRPLLLVIDDLHRADRPSLLLLKFLARAIEKLRIVTIGTARELEARSDPEVARLIDEIARDATTMSLGGLSLEDAAVLIECSLAAAPPRNVLRSLHSATDGNPYCLGEFTRLVRAETGTARTPRWKSFRLPADTRAAIGRHLDTLGAECRRVLSIASVLGREFAITPLREASGLTRTALLDTLAGAERAGLLRSNVREGRGRAFAHALVREVLYEELSSERRASLHREIAESLARLHDSDPDAPVAEIAHHFFEAARGGLVDGRAAEYEKRAGERALTLLAYEEAQAHYRRALELLELAPCDDRVRCEILLALGEASNKAGDLGAARDAFTRAAALARTIRSPEHLSRAAVALGVPWLDPTTVDVERVALLEEALAALGEGASAIRVRVLARLALALYWDPSAAARRDSLSREAIDLARRLDDPATLAYALEARHYALWTPDHVEERLAAATEMARLAERLRNPEVELSACVWRLFDLLEIGDIQAVDVEIARRIRLAEELRQPLHRSLATVSRAMRAILDGRFAAAERLAKEALALGTLVQPSGAEVRFVAQMVVLRRLEGRAEEAESPLRGMIERYPAEVSFRCGLAAVYADLGRAAESRAEFEIVAARAFTDLRRDVTWASNLAYLTDACVFLGDAARAGLLYEIALPYAARNLVVGAGLAGLGSGSRLLGLLASLLGRPDDAARHFEAALRANERMGARPWVACVQREYAEVLRARGETGDRERAAGLLERALATARELGMKRLEKKVEVAAGRSRAGRRLELRKEDESWVVGYRGSVSRFRNSKGLGLLAHLVKHPDTDFLPDELEAAVRGRAAEASAADGPTAEQTRVNLTKALKAVIGKIAAADPPLGTHLRAAIHTGRVFRYGPQPTSPAVRAHVPVSGTLDPR